MHLKQRNHWQITWSVYKGLFFREFLTRIVEKRYAWFWIIIEPMGFIVFFLSMRIAIRGRDMTIAGSNGVLWMTLGIATFFMIRNAATRSLNAISSNKGLFSYRQVQPIDTVIVRTFLEGFIQLLVIIAFLLILSLIDTHIIPSDAIFSSIAFISAWLLGLSVAITFSALSVLISGVDKFIRMLMMPLLILSGVIFPLHRIPEPILYYLMFNPIVHALELLRYYYLDNYWTLPGVSWLYLYSCILGFLLIGLSLFLRFPGKLRLS